MTTSPQDQPAAPAVRFALEHDVAILTIASLPVNALSVTVRAGLEAGLQAALANPAVVAIVLANEGQAFSAGADIKEFGKPRQSPDLRDIVAALEASQKPVVAAIDGTALGGGLELALACHYRIGSERTSAGLPEVKIGLIPGAGGTQRLPRLVGLEGALDIMTSGNPLSATEALSAGILDAVVPSGELREQAIRHARALGSDRETIRRSGAIDSHRASYLADRTLFDRYRSRNARKFRGAEAPEQVIQCVEASARLPLEEGLRIERETFDRLVLGEQSKALRYAFFAERQAMRFQSDEARAVNRVGIVGAGTMGTGIAMSFANAGIPARIVEARSDALERGLANIRKTYESSASKGRLDPEEAEARRNRISGHLGMADLADCDLIIEAAFEELSVKRAIFTELDKVARPGAILATNTSYLDVDLVAKATGRPESVLGMHFFSPANIMRLVEIVRAEKTAPEVLATARRAVRDLGKVGVVVGVCHGFVGNRMLEKRQREADRLILEGAEPWRVDRVLVDFGLPMGPFSMADLAGLDLGWSPETSRGETVRELLCEAGRRGQKTAAGYYDYAPDRSATPSAVTMTFIGEVAARAGIEPRDIGNDEILDRLLLPVINEGAKILEEGKAGSASDIDVIWLNGYGFPAYRGGPMYHADSIGLEEVRDRLKRLEARFGERFRPADLIERLASERRGFLSR